MFKVTNKIESWLGLTHDERQTTNDKQWTLEYQILLFLVSWVVCHVPFFY